MPIEVLVTTRGPVPAGGRGGAAPPPPVRTSHVVLLSDQHHVFTFPADVEPASVVLDPNAWVMMQSTLEKR